MFQSGDMVRIKSLDEINATLDAYNGERETHIYFNPDMADYCDQPVWVINYFGDGFQVDSDDPAVAAMTHGLVHLNNWQWASCWLAPVEVYDTDPETVTALEEML